MWEQMFEQMGRTAALLAVGAAFSSGAWGQALTQSVSNVKTIAAEYFGAAEGRVVARRSAANNPTAFTVRVQEGAIGAGNEADLTLSLTQATFVDRVSLSSFASSDEHASLKLEAGGEAGDSSVTVRVAVVGGDLENGAITFTIPDIRMTPERGSEVPISNVFPRSGALMDASITAVRRTANPFPDVVGDSSNSGRDAPPQVIYRVSEVLVFPVARLGQRQDIRYVELMDRKVLAIDAPFFDPEEGMWFGGVSLGAFPGMKALAEEDGRDDDVGVADFPGDFVVTATGHFQTGDKAILSSSRLDDSEMMRNEDGSYSGRIAFEAAPSFLYVPGGVEDLRPGVIRGAVAVQVRRSKERLRSAEGWAHQR